MIEKPKKSALLDRSHKRRKDVPLRYLTYKPVKCIYCAMPEIARCEFPRCGAPMCDRHRIKKFGGNLCRDHQNAMLLQAEGEAANVEPVDGEASKRFTARGDAIAHEPNSPDS